MVAGYKKVYNHIIQQFSPVHSHLNTVRPNSPILHTAFSRRQTFINVTISLLYEKNTCAQPEALRGPPSVNQSLYHSPVYLHHMRLLLKLSKQ